MANKGIFDTVLKVNKDYVDAIKRGAGKEEQENLLTACKIIMQTMIIDAGLANDYADYCKNR